MPATSPRPEPPRSMSARDRVAARRAARRRPAWRLLPVALALLGLITIAALAFVLQRTDQTLATIQQSDPRQKPASSSAAAQQPGQSVRLEAPLTILLIGVDKRPNLEEGVRSDTLILVRLDPQAKWAAMLSIPRDSVVQIPHLGQAKINAAYAHGYTHAADIYGSGTNQDAGGGALAAETVEQFLNVRIDYVAQVDFHGFEQLIDAVGGLLLDVPRPLLDAEFPTEDYGVERIYVPPGLQVLDGHQALIYARSRHSSTDFDRSQRQQQVLRALLNQVKARGLLENAALLPQWADLVAQHVRTTLPVRDIGMLNGLAALARDLDSGRLVQLSINPDDVAVIENGSDLYWDQNDIAALMARWQAGPDGA